MTDAMPAFPAGSIITPRWPGSLSLSDRAQTVGHYRIIERLGSGGMGEVYLADDSKLRRKVALKILRPQDDGPERRQRYEREGRALASLNHPNIVTLYSLEEWRGTQFITMEWVDGRTLREVLNSSGPLPLVDLIDIAVQTADGLAEAHARRLVHRDLKPQNIMVTARGLVKILDFGLVKNGSFMKVDDQLSRDERPVAMHDVEDAIQSETRLAERTLEGALVGTVAYMSPEQILGKELDSRSDLFSLGAVLYELATARQPFRGGSLVSILAQILESEPTPLSELRPELPGQLDRIIRRCLQKEKSRRYSDARSLALDLMALQQDPEGHEQPGPAVAGVSARLLLVEDEPSLARGLADNFRDEGFNVRTVANGDEAMPALADFRPDLLVLDIMLPGRSGLDILRDLRARGDNLPVLILTSKGDLTDRVVGLELGADDYLAKPFAARELLARVRALLRRVGGRDSATTCQAARSRSVANARVHSAEARCGSEMTGSEDPLPVGRTRQKPPTFSDIPVTKTPGAFRYFLQKRLGRKPKGEGGERS
jgi:serine/threonine protein kinase